MVKAKNDYLLKCPLCRKKLWYSSITSHRKTKHKTLSAKEFEKILIESIRSGNMEPAHYSNANIPGNRIKSGTQKVARAKKTAQQGIISLVSGGKISPR